MEEYFCNNLFEEGVTSSCFQEMVTPSSLPFSSEVGRNLTPFFSFPFLYGGCDVVGTEPILGSGYDLIQLFSLRVAFQLGLALFLLYPQLRVHAVAIYHLVGNAPLLHESQGVHDGKKFANVVGAVQGPIVKYPCSCLQVDALVFHRSWVSRAGCVDSPCVGIYFHGQGQHGVVSP